MASTTRIVSGRLVLLVCASLVVLLAGIAGWWMIKERPRAGSYIDVLALDGDYAVAIRHEQTSGRAFLELLGLDEGLRWQALVPHYEVPDGALGVAASERAITVRFARDGRTQLFGFATLGAHKLGTVILGDELSKEPDGHRSAQVATLPAGGQSFEILEPDGGPVRVYALSLDSGEIEWRHDLPGAGIDSAWVTDAHVVFEQPGGFSVLARDGEVALEGAATQLCVIPGYDGGDDQLVTSSGVGRERLDVVRPGQGLEDRSWELEDGEAFTGICGGRGGRVFAVVERAGASSLLTLSAIGAPVRLALGAGSVATAPTRALRVNEPLGAPFAGELPAIVPLLIDDGRGARLVGVDVVRGAVAWSSTPSPALRDAVLIDAGDAVLIHAGELLISIDPATGAARAVRAPGIRRLRAHHVAGGTVWLIGDRGLRALDAKTLATKGTWQKGPPAADPADADLAALGLQTSR